MKRQERLDRLQGIWQEYLVANSALSMLEARLRDDPSVGTDEGWRPREARALRSNLEGTFLIRMFAEFEAALRNLWREFLGQSTHPPMRDLLAAISSRMHVTKNWESQADRVRIYRNKLIHDEAKPTEILSLAEAKATLNRILSRFPLDW